MGSIEVIGIVLGGLSIFISVVLFFIATCRHGVLWFLCFWFFQPIGALCFIWKYQKDSKKPLLWLLAGVLFMMIPHSYYLYQLSFSPEERQLAKQRSDDSEKIGTIIERELKSQKIEELKEFNKIIVTPDYVVIAFSLNSENANDIKLAKRLARIAVISPEVVQKNNANSYNKCNTSKVS